MNEDGLSILDIENCILSGSIRSAKKILIQENGNIVSMEKQWVEKTWR